MACGVSRFGLNLDRLLCMTLGKVLSSLSSFPHLQSKGNCAFLVYLQRFHK